MYSHTHKSALIHNLEWCSAIQGFDGQMYKGVIVAVKSTQWVIESFS